MQIGIDSFASVMSDAATGVTLWFALPCARDATPLAAVGVSSDGVVARVRF